MGGDGARARSRSPKSGSKNAEWISRTICQFGRYPHKRPKDIWVNDDGGIRITDLMEHWAHQHGLVEQDITKAVHAHMFHEDGTLRFSFTPSDDGSIIIRVMPKRHGQKAGKGTHTWNQQSRNEPQGQAWNQATAPLWQEVPWRDQTPTKPRPVVKVSDWSNRTPGKPRPQPQGRQGNAWHQAPVNNVAIAPQQSARKLTPARPTLTTTDDKLDSALDDVIRAEVRPTQYFHIGGNGGGGKPGAQHRRPVQRLWPGDPASAPWTPASTGSGSAKLLRPTRGRAKACLLPRQRDDVGERKGRRSSSSESSCSRAGSGGGQNASASTTADDELAELARSGLNLTTPLDMSDAFNLDKPPPKPPGDHWTHFKDDDVIWYYYEGPLGKWWYHDGMPGDCPEPYDD